PARARGGGAGGGGARRAGPADRLVDAALAAAVRRLAEPPGLRFTERQLYYEVCRVLRPADRLPRRVGFTVGPALGHERFTAALHRHGIVPAMLPPVVGETTRRHGWLAAEDDVLDYGLPRLLVCEDTAIARMLVANDAHLEAACPVFAIEDLPLDPRLVAALDRFPGAAVHVLHDASAGGLALAGGLRARLGLAPSVPVVPIGLLPRHAAAMHLPARRLPARPNPARPNPAHRSFAHRDTVSQDATRQDAVHRDAVLHDPAARPPGGPDEAGDAAPPGGEPLESPPLTRREQRWIRSGLRAEVAAVPPARLLRAVHRLVGSRGPAEPRGGGLGAARSVGFMTWPAP
ncbi:hypothetical protein, partial [Frankia nepalensis]|uniref:hypothetical protein n=1 Tax=Frankia nepalensis TaxID=1836974 RepID=UPI001EE47F1D